MALPSVWSVLRVAIPFLWVVGLLSVRLAGASQDSGTVIPAESVRDGTGNMPLEGTIPHKPHSTTTSLSHLVGEMCPSCSTMSRRGAAMLSCKCGRCRSLRSPGKKHESRPCVDCHAFEFMQRALQDLKKTAYNLDTRTETLLLRAEKRGLCDCFRAIH